MTRLLIRLRERLANRSGNAAVEFALLVPILLILVVGTVDLGLGFNEKLRLQSALNSGLQHAMLTQGSDPGTTRTVIEHNSSRPASISVEVICRCQASVVLCQSPCPKQVKRYVRGTASAPYTTPVFELEMTLAASFELYVGEVA